MRRRSAVEKWTPVGYFALALAVVALVLPTALRPPEPPPPTSAELSPDAPPDDQLTVLSELNRGASTTAGAGTPGEILIGEGPGEARLEFKPRSCKYGFGNPPRQTASVYAPGCAPAFVGDNGGATHRGVTQNEIRIAIGSTTAGQRNGHQGPTREPRADDNAQTRTYRAWEAYFNDAFELYGRSLKFVHFNPGTGQSAGRAAMQEIHQEYEPFAVLTTHQGAHDEATRLGYVAFGSYQRPKSYYRRDAPHAWSWVMDGTQMVLIVAEFMCKQLQGKPPQYNERQDPSFDYDAPRKFGIVLLDTQDYQSLEKPFRERFKQCGGEPSEFVFYNYGSDGSAGGGAEAFGTMVSRFRAAGVTTTVCFCDYVAMIAFLSSATNQGYYPEWVVTAASAIDTNQVGQLYDPAQWRHALGIGFYEMTMPQQWRDYYRAYKRIDPDREPHAGAGRYIWPFLFQIVTGLQSAGPNLTPSSFIEGMFRYGGREPDPPWYVAGHYGPDDFTFADYVSYIWWDTATIDPDNSVPGAYRYLFGGKRFKYGELPADDNLPWFREGIASPPNEESLRPQ